MEIKKYTKENEWEITQWGTIDEKNYIIPSPVLEPSEDYPDGRYLQIETPNGFKTAILGDCIIKDDDDFFVYSFNTTRTVLCDANDAEQLISALEVLEDKLTQENIISVSNIIYENLKANDIIKRCSDEELVDEICKRGVVQTLADKLLEELDAYEDVTKLISEIEDRSHEITFSNRRELKALCFSDYNEDEWFSPSNIREEMLIEKLARTFRKIHPDVLEHFLDFYD